MQRSDKLCVGVYKYMYVTLCVINDIENDNNNLAVWTWIHRDTYICNI